MVDELHRFSPAYLAQYILMLPLNLIPVVGTAAFLIIQGRKAAPSYHSRYFQLKGFSSAQKESYLKENQAGYVGYVQKLPSGYRS